MDKSDLIVCLSGGLGNRLHTLYSCHYLTLFHKIIFTYEWTNDYGSGCRADHLFETDLNFIYSEQDIDYTNRILLEGNILKKQDLDKKIYWKQPYAAQYENFSITDTLYKSVFYSIKFNQIVEQKINSIVIPDKTIGIHVRGGDIKDGSIDPSRKYIGTNKFIQLMNDELSKNPNTVFFLSCENQEDEIVLCENFDHKNIIKLKIDSHDRRTVNGVINAFVQLVLLSKCSSIIGINSSFSTFACRIGNAKKINLG